MNAGRAVVSLETICCALADRAEGLAAALLPLGHREGPEWVDAHRDQGGMGDSMRVHLRSPRAGVWSHFGGDGQGDALDLICYVKALSKGDAIKWARHWLGYDSASAPLETADTRRHQAKRREASLRAGAQDTEKRRRGAQSLWLSAQERIAGTPAGDYLAGRGIDLAALGRQPRALRFHPCLLTKDKDREVSAPGLVAAINDGAGKFLAVHRTFLGPAPDGGWTKAPFQYAKKTYGDYRGGFIRLWRGTVTDPETGEVTPAPPIAKAKPGSCVLISEGIEDGLTAACAAPENRVIAAVALANMANIVLPEAIETVVILQQNDKPGSKAAKALDKAIDAYLRQGREVRLARPPEGAKDVNDMVMETG